MRETLSLCRHSQSHQLSDVAQTTQDVVNTVHPTFRMASSYGPLRASKRVRSTDDLDTACPRKAQEVFGIILQDKSYVSIVTVDCQANEGVSVLLQVKRVIIWRWSDKLYDIAMVVVGAVGLSNRDQLRRWPDQGCLTVQSEPHMIGRSGSIDKSCTFF